MGQPSLSTVVCVNTAPSLHSRVRARCPSIRPVLPSVSAATTGIWTPSIRTYILGMVCLESYPMQDDPENDTGGVGVQKRPDANTHAERRSPDGAADRRVFDSER